MEFDNAAEARLPHRTARGPTARAAGPWLVSQPMWANFLRFVDGATLPLAELSGPARMPNLAGLRRWGYLDVGPPPAEQVSLTAAGQAAAEVFRPLAAEIQDALRVLSPDGVPVRDLPVLAGVAREQIAASIILLERTGLLTLAPAASGRGKQAVLTDRGAAAQRSYRRTIADVDNAWRSRFGADTVDKLDAALRAILGRRDALIETLTPPPTGWRAHSPYTARTAALLADPAARLPHYPMVSHRGGYPDGS